MIDPGSQPDDSEPVSKLVLRQHATVHDILADVVDVLVVYSVTLQERCRGAGPVQAAASWFT